MKAHKTVQHDVHTHEDVEVMVYSKCKKVRISHNITVFAESGIVASSEESIELNEVQIEALLPILRQYLADQTAKQAQEVTT